ncbi:actin-binding Rho-activating protein [Drosophila obscura]|uniref:actin-binding Rho-activating protein n=1 Tax=Drosophila obscura TaxID=7282 RepID=UPI001BB10CEC|nr:actin-binding Rho-activating protein [Drosophila obscura]
MSAKQVSFEEETSVSSRITLFNKRAEEHQNWMVINPFAHYTVREMPKRLIRQEDYGHAPAGSRSEQRSQLAHAQALQEVLQLCEEIHKLGQPSPKTGQMGLSFGELFERYTSISEKLMGTLLAARRQGYVAFEGETLFQGKDEQVPVCLLRSFDELRLEIMAKAEDLTKKEHVD